MTFILYTIVQIKQTVMDIFYHHGGIKNSSLNTTGGWTIPDKVPLSSFLPIFEHLHMMKTNDS
jgi:hypothetical protein